MTRRYHCLGRSLPWCKVFRMINFRTISILVLSVFCLLGVATASSTKYLYEGKTNHVKEYHPERNKPELLFMSVKAPRVVEFYSPHCPACQAFAPSYMKLASNTNELYPEVQFFAVSCDHYEDVCDQYDIRGYPAIRLFKEGDDPSSKGKVTEFDEDQAEGKRVPRKLADYFGFKPEDGTKTSQKGKNDNGDNSVKENKDIENPKALAERELGKSNEANDVKSNAKSKDNDGDDDDEEVEESNDGTKNADVDKTSNDLDDENNDKSVDKSQKKDGKGTDNASKDKVKESVDKNKEKGDKSAGDATDDGNEKVSKSVHKNKKEKGKSTSDGNSDGSDKVSKPVDKNKKKDDKSNSDGSDNNTVNESAEKNKKKDDKSTSTDNDDEKKDDKSTGNASNDHNDDDDDEVSKSVDQDKKKDGEIAGNDDDDEVSNSVDQDEKKDGEIAGNDDDDEVSKSVDQDEKKDNDSSGKDDDDEVSKSIDQDEKKDNDSFGKGDDDEVSKSVDQDKKKDGESAGNDDDDEASKSVDQDKKKDSVSKDSEGGDDDSSGDDDEYNSNIDQYVELRKAEKEKFMRLKSKYVRGFLAADEEETETASPSFQDMTKGMKQFTPGTKEYAIRKAALNKRIQKLGRGHRHHHYPDGYTKATLPLRKYEPRPKFLNLRKMSPEEELILDTTLSLTVALTLGMTMGIDDITSKKAMSDWLDLLSVSLPLEWNVHKLIDELRMNFEYATKSRDYFRSVVTRYKRTQQHGWSRSCRNEEMGSEGFTCGFWKLLHVVTLGVAEQRGGQNLIDAGLVSSNTVVFSPASAADTIRNYIDKFFTCRPCREHFLKTYDNCKNNKRCARLSLNKDVEDAASWKELPMWLWEFHNDVSVRLVEERIGKTYTMGVKNTASRRDKVAVTFPNVKNCILCLNDDGTWNRAQVFRFLERSYWPDSETDPLTDKLLRAENEDIWKSVLLWLISFLVVGLVFMLTAKESLAIRQPLIAARRLVTQGRNGKLRTY